MYVSHCDSCITTVAVQMEQYILSVVLSYMSMSAIYKHRYLHKLAVMVHLYHGQQYDILWSQCEVHYIFV